MSATADYLGDADGGLSRTPEMSRRGRQIPVYAALRNLGRRGIADLVERCCGHARRLADAMERLDGAAVLNDVVLNQVLLRFDDDDAVTDDVVAGVQDSGEAWLGGTRWHGVAAARVSFSNWSTSDDDVDRLAAALESALAAARAGGHRPLASPRVSAEGLRNSVEKMEAEGLPDAAIRTFRHYYEQLESGETGMLPEADIEPVEDVVSLEDLPDEEGPLGEAVVLKLNGGLGTSMGMTRAKSLIEAKDGLTFLDVVARQVAALRERADAPVPLVLMNSFYTRDESLEALSALRRAVVRRAGRTSSSTRSRSCSWTPWSRSRGRPTRRRSGARPATATSTRRC